MKPRRNEPCSCGSGKKFKNCCMGNAKLLAVGPTSADLNQLVALSNAGRHTELETQARAIIERYPNSGFAWKLLGQSLYMQGKYSLPALRKATELLPNDADAYNNFGIVLTAQGQLNEAVSSCRRALQIKPDDIRALNSLGSALHELGKLAEAVTSYRRALQIKPDYAKALNNLGTALQDLGQTDEAAASFRRALEIEPGYLVAQSNLLFTLTHTTCAPKDYLAEAHQYGRMVARKVPARFTSWQCLTAPERLRVGLVSGDFNNHPVGYFLESLLGQLDYTGIELFAYVTNPKADELTARIRQYFSAWKPLYGLSDEVAARLIQADDVNVLLDLSGHSKHNRLPVFAWKPAPVQASWLGYWASTGVAEMDYLLADKSGVPEVQHDEFSETVWYLPDTRLCFTAPETDLPVATLPALKNGYITFGCFQKLAKVGDEVLITWGNILNELPGSKLRWQCKQLGDPAMTAQLVERLQHHGIDSERVTLLGSVSRNSYLAAHAEVDIVLDTFPYPGGTTTCEALWMGVPTLTLAGETMLARQGASLLNAAGLGDWVAAGKKDYIDKAIQLTVDLPRLATVRAGLREQVGASPLFDAPRFARHLGAALRGMWQARIPNNSPTHSELPETSPERKRQVQIGSEFKRPVLPSQSTPFQVNALIALYDAGRYQELESQARRLVEQCPDYGFAWKLLGGALQMQGKNALSAFQRLVELMPGEADAHYNLGVALKKTGLLADATASYRRALQIKPDYAEAHCNLGNVLKDLGRLDEAVASYRRAVTLKPDFALAFYNLGNALKGLGHLDEAVTSYRKALDTKPDFTEAHNSLESTLQDIGASDNSQL